MSTATWSSQCLEVSPLELTLNVKPGVNSQMKTEIAFSNDTFALLSAPNPIIIN